MTDKNIIGSRLRKARKVAKPPLTQLDLVARLQLLGLSIDQSAISKIEAGRRPVFDYELAALAKALRVPVTYFFEDVEP
jgi:transcriptional regulator with XRE-family HTH domain